MLTERPRTTDFGVIYRLFDAIEGGDMDAMRRCFAPGALTWHNHDNVEMDLDSVVGLIGHLCSVSTSRAYTDRRVATVDAQAFVQHTLTAALRSGRQLQMPTIMRIEVNSDGLVARLEEYLDSRAFDCLAEEVPA